MLPLEFLKYNYLLEEGVKPTLPTSAIYITIYLNTRSSKHYEVTLKCVCVCVLPRKLALWVVMEIKKGGVGVTPQQEVTQWGGARNTGNSHERD